jgi:hypothetical protein
MVSTGPPAANGTTRVIGRVGQFCAGADVVSMAKVPTAARSVRSIMVLP